MLPSPAVRLPLQIGTSSSWAMAGASVFLGVALVLAWALVGAVRVGLPAWIWLFLAVLLVPIGNLALRKLRKARRLRPSDALFRQDALCVEGGPHDGLVLPWRDIDAGACRAEYGLLDAAAEGIPAREARQRGAAVLRVQVATREGGRILLAESDRLAEKESLDAVLDCIVGMAAAGDAVSPPDPRVLHCSVCGAPAVPADAESVTCPYCGHPVAIPPALRVAARVVSRDDEGLVRRVLPALVRKTPASRVAWWLRGSAALMLSAFPLAIAFVWQKGSARSLTALQLGQLLAFAGALFASGFMFSRMALLDRRALRLLAVRFGARPPARAGGPPTCRCCGGPLAFDASPLVARCVYCNSENIAGFDLRRARSHEAEGESVEAAVKQRGTDRKRALVFGAAAAALLTASAVTLARGLGPRYRLDVLGAPGETRSLERISDRPEHERAPTLASDGRTLRWEAIHVSIPGLSSVVSGIAEPRTTGKPAESAGIFAHDPRALAGTAYLFVDRNRSRSRLAYLDDSTAEPQTLLEGRSIGRPAASRDGRRIVVSVAGGLSLVEPSAGSATVAPICYQGDEPALSPDGERLAWNARGTIAVAPVGECGVVQHFAQPEGRHEAPAWSPDGRRLVFVSNAPQHGGAPQRGAPRHLFVANADGSGVARLTEGDASCATPEWAADGFIYFAANIAGDYDIWRIRAPR